MQRLQQRRTVADIQRLLQILPASAFAERGSQIFNGTQIGLPQITAVLDDPLLHAQAGQKIAGIQLQRSPRMRDTLLRRRARLIRKTRLLLEFPHIGGDGDFRVPNVTPALCDDKAFFLIRFLQKLAKRIRRVFQRAGRVFDLIALPQAVHQLLIRQLFIAAQQKQRQKLQRLVEPRAVLQNRRTVPQDRHTAEQGYFHFTLLRHFPLPLPNQFGFSSLLKGVFPSPHNACSV